MLNNSRYSLMVLPKESAKPEIIQIASLSELNKADGEYVAFISDHCQYSDEMIRKMIHKAKDTNADVLLYTVRRYLGSDQRCVTEKSFNEKFIPKNRNTFCAKDCGDHAFDFASEDLYARLYKKQYLLNKDFCSMEDLSVFEKASLLCAGRIACDEEIFVTINEEKPKSKKHDESYFVSLFQALRERNAYDDLKKQLSEQIAKLCSEEIASALTASETDTKVKHIQSVFLPSCGFKGDESDHLKALGMIADCHKQAIIRKASPDQIAYTEGNDEIAVSVIMPLYNVENYIRESLGSVADQTLSEIEIICINDGSTDGTLSVLEEFAKKDSRIHVYTQKNEGQSSARNHGLKYASGKYIYFMDGDDILEKDALKLTYERVCEDDLDVVYFDGSSFADPGASEADAVKYSTYYTRVHAYEGVYRGSELFAKMYANGEYRVSPCLQLIRRKLMMDEDILYTNGIIHEDNVFSFRVMLKAERAGYIHQSLFNRRVRNSSVMTSGKTWKNAVGYFVCYIEMQKFLDTLDLDEEAMNQAAVCIYRILHNARNDYKSLPSAERYAYEGLSQYERTRFLLHVKEIVHELDIAKDLRNKNKEQREEIERLNSSTVSGTLKGILKKGIKSVSGK